MEISPPGRLCRIPATDTGLAVGFDSRHRCDQLRDAPPPEKEKGSGTEASPQGEARREARNEAEERKRRREASNGEAATDAEKVKLLPYLVRSRKVATIAGRRRVIASPFDIEQIAGPAAMKKRRKGEAKLRRAKRRGTLDPDYNE